MAKKSNAIPNAEGVIEAFGGIRPMAKKMDVAVTTVQGWKKRDAIPAARLAQVLAAAEEHDIDLGGILDGQPAANENSDSAKDVSKEPSVAAVAVEVVEETNTKVAQLDAEPDAQSDDSKAVDEPIELTDEAVSEDNEDFVVVSSAKYDADTEASVEDLKLQIAQIEKETARKGAFVAVLVAVLLLSVLGVFAYLLLGPTKTDSQVDLGQLQTLEAEIDAVQNDVNDVKEEQGVLGGLIPKDLGAQIEGLKQQAQQAQEKIGEVAERAQSIKDDVLLEGTAGAQERIGALGTQLQGRLQENLQGVDLGSFTNVPALSGLLSKVQRLQGDLGGQAQLEESFLAIQNVLSGASTGLNGFSIDGVGLDGQSAAADNAPVDINTALDVARAENSALGETFADVPTQDLKAAALLLGMTQFRSTLNRDGEAFEGDLGTLMTLVGGDNLELTSALERLAPHAQSGVLSPSGLMDEFKNLAGEAVIASIKGEDVSIQERAQSRFNELFQVEKNGELLTGTPTQATLVKAQNLLEDGDIEGAIANAQSLGAFDPDAAQVIAPWLDQARGTLKAQAAQEVIDRALPVSAEGAAPNRSFKAGNTETINPLAP